MSDTPAKGRFFRIFRIPFLGRRQAGDAPPISRKERSPFYLAGLLGFFSLIGAAVLAGGFEATEGAVRNRQREDLLSSLSLVIPSDLHDNDLVADSYALDDGTIIYPAREGSITSGVAYEVVGQGYGGAIRILMGVRTDGSILGVRVLQHAETPGLGDRIEAAKSKWIAEFSGTSLDNVSERDWAVKKDGGRFDQFSGATITPRAVVRAVHEGLIFFQSHRNELTSEPGESQT